MWFNTVSSLAVALPAAVPRILTFVEQIAADVRPGALCIAGVNGGDDGR